jgi:hypothetical protein
LASRARAVWHPCRNPTATYGVAPCSCSHHHQRQEKTRIIGIVGALLGGFLASAIFNAHPLDEFFDISTWLTAIVGSIVLLVIYRVVTGNTRRGLHV